MTLVGYSDSEDSGAEDAEQARHQASVPEETPSKPKFQKLIDRSNPRKIQVNLGDNTASTSESYDEEKLEHPGKRARTEKGGFGGFNAMLPAPKRTTPKPSSGTQNGARKPIGSGISLKTGAAPGFSREPIPDPGSSLGDETEGGDVRSDDEPSAGASLEANIADNGSLPTDYNQVEPKRTGNSMMFKPLSVARKPQKKKPPSHSTTSAGASQVPTNGASKQAPNPPPKVSLFSMGDADVDSGAHGSNTSDGDYQPYLERSQDRSRDPEGSGGSLDQSAAKTEPNVSSKPVQAQSLTSLASSLNLTAAQRRQLFGRNATDKNVTVVNFSADDEYEANEEQRRLAEAGGSEQQPHNPVRAIAPGKHSLKQLVNAVAGQRDALEESFATGKRNRKEAGNKYGW